MSDKSASEAGPVSFGERLANSDVFAALFREGMALVEETASYLDGPGRAESKKLERAAALAYATESMRLTTRLLELASWLMIRRALKSGEISAEEARAKRQRVKLKGPGRPSHVKGFVDLPEGLRQLIEQSFSLNDRIVQLDRAMEVAVGEATSAENPVGAQVTRLQEAFAHTRRRANARDSRPAAIER